MKMERKETRQEMRKRKKEIEKGHKVTKEIGQNKATEKKRTKKN